MLFSSWAKPNYVFGAVPLQLVLFCQFGASLCIGIGGWCGDMEGSSGLLLSPFAFHCPSVFFHAGVKFVQIAHVLWVSACHTNWAALLEVFPRLSWRQFVGCIRRPI